MAYKLLTCPETAHLEMIEYDEHALGMLVLTCSRYRPACAVACTRTCAARLDQKRLLDRIRAPEIDVQADELDVGDRTNYERTLGAAPTDFDL
jgi:hypothetical protein